MALHPEQVPAAEELRKGYITERALRGRPVVLGTVAELWNAPARASFDVGENAGDRSAMIDERRMLALLELCPPRQCTITSG
jgi:hypothetical protein